LKLRLAILKKMVDINNMNLPLLQSRCYSYKWKSN